MVALWEWCRSGLTDETLIFEPLVNVAITLEVRRWTAESRGVRVVRKKSGWEYLVPWEEPSANRIAVPFHDVVTTATAVTRTFDVVEVLAEGVGADFIDVATECASSLKGAVVVDLGVSLTETVDFAVGVSMEGDFVDLVVVYAFDDVNLYSISTLPKCIGCMIHLPLPLRARARGPETKRLATCHRHQASA